MNRQPTWNPGKTKLYISTLQSLGLDVEREYSHGIIDRKIRGRLICQGTLKKQKPYLGWPKFSFPPKYGGDLITVIQVPSLSNTTEYSVKVAWEQVQPEYLEEKSYTVFALKSISGHGCGDTLWQGDIKKLPRGVPEEHPNFICQHKEAAGLTSQKILNENFENLTHGMFKVREYYEEIPGELIELYIELIKDVKIKAIDRIKILYENALRYNESTNLSKIPKK